MTLHVDILTLFPGYFDSPLRESLVGRAIDAQLLSTTIINIRDFATDKHKKADDEPFGGGAGMVMKPEPLVGAIEFASQANPTTEVIFLTPQGEPLTHQLAAELAQKPALTFVCGHYEGIGVCGMAGSIAIFRSVILGSPAASPQRSFCSMRLRA